MDRQGQEAQRSSKTSGDLGIMQREKLPHSSKLRRVSSDGYYSPQSPQTPPPPENPPAGAQTPPETPAAPAPPPTPHRPGPPRHRPMIPAANIPYELGERVGGLAAGGIGAMLLLARKTGLIREIDRHLHLLKVHLPYHESDHVLNIAFNILAGG